MERVMEEIASSIVLGGSISCLAMFMGSFSISRGFEAICISGGLSIACLLFAILTMYLAAIAFDLRRQKSDRRDCCTLFRCDQNSVFCCRGRYLNKEAGSEKSSAISLLQKIVTHSVGRFVIVIVFLALCAASALGARDIQQHIDRKDLFTDDQVTYKYYDFWEKYFFSEGDNIFLVIDNDTFIKSTTQQSYKTFITHLKACTGCSTDWVIDDTVTEWYSLFTSYAFTSGCTSGAMSSGTDLVPDQFFMICFKSFITSDFGTNMQNAMVYDSSAIISQIVPFKTTRETSQKAGRSIYEDLKKLVETYGLSDTYFYSSDMFLFEAYDLQFDSITLVSLL